MKNLNEYINECILEESFKDTVKNLLSKIVWPGLSKNDKFLLKFIEENETKRRIQSAIDSKDPEELGFEMEQYGGLTTVVGTADVNFESEDKVRKAFDLDTNWKKSSINDDVYIFLPALKSWNLKLEDVDTKEVMAGVN